LCLLTFKYRFSVDYNGVPFQWADCKLMPQVTNTYTKMAHFIIE
jgi:uncharacterized membrane protein YjdF